MRKRSHISVVEGEQENAATPVDTPEATALELEDEAYESEEWSEYAPPSTNISAWIAPILATIAIVGWTAFFAWAHRAEMLAGGSAQVWTAWITAWAMPVLLVLAAWLLASRNSTAESKRFGEIARSLAEESAQLEVRLATVNRELSLAREFLGSQSRELEFLGRSAGERLSEHADRLQGLVRDNGEQVEAIASVSGTALENMTRLRDNLPVIANSAKDVSNQIAGAGRTSQDQLDKLVEGFDRLNEFGAASERQVVSLQMRVDDALEAFSAQAGDLEKISAQRFAVLREESDQFRSALDAREVEALAAIRERSATLRSELAEAHQTASAEEELALSSLRERLARFRDEATKIAAAVRAGEDGAIAKWGSQVDAMKLRLAETADNIETIENSLKEAALARFNALGAEAESIKAMVRENAEMLDTEGKARLDAIALSQDQLSQELSDKLEALDIAIAQRREAQREQMGILMEQGEVLDTRFAALASTFDTVTEQGREATETVASGVASLNETLIGSREALDGTDQAVAALTDASVRLLELIQASARHSREDLPIAMDASEGRLAQIETRTAAVRGLLDEARVSGESLTEGMAEIEKRTLDAIEGFERFQSDFGDTANAQIEGVERLRFGVVSLREESEQLAQRVQVELREAIAALESSAKGALDALETENAARITALAEKVGERSSAAIDEALAEHTDEALAKLDAARDRSTEAARATTRELRDQLARLNDLTGNLEARIAHAREQAADTVDGDFARRVALITESLNSNAIDISKALSAEVTDMAWSSYLRGDRGIFTRRAVRLIDNGEAREIAELYDADPDFREHVNRYIHDFEAMLRNLLSTRDGNALSVTLLSSDMGKLYVVMAQALERLRQ